MKQWEWWVFALASAMLVVSSFKLDLKAVNHWKVAMNKPVVYSQAVTSKVDWWLLGGTILGMLVAGVRVIAAKRSPRQYDPATIGTGAVALLAGTGFVKGLKTLVYTIVPESPKALENYDEEAMILGACGLMIFSAAGAVELFRRK